MLIAGQTSRYSLGAVMDILAMLIENCDLDMTLPFFGWHLSANGPIPVIAIAIVAVLRWRI
jgi:hypothetical protein